MLGLVAWLVRGDFGRTQLSWNGCKHTTRGETFGGLGSGRVGLGRMSGVLTMVSGGRLWTRLRLKDWENGLGCPQSFLRHAGFRHSGCTSGLLIGVLLVVGVVSE